jgi:hypothetical protein
MSLELALLLSRNGNRNKKSLKSETKITFDAAQQKCPFTVNLPVLVRSLSDQVKTVGLVSAADFKAAAIEAETHLEAEQAQLRKK